MSISYRLAEKERTKDKEEILRCTSEIVSAWASNHCDHLEGVLSAISKVYSCLSNLNSTNDSLSPNKPSAVDPAKSITPGYLICLEDGKQLKMLKRHLRTSYGLTPEQYRERWNLPSDYPMVAPDYARKRSSLAKTNGLGQARARMYQYASSSINEAAAS